MPPKIRKLLPAGIALLSCLLAPAATVHAQEEIRRLPLSEALDLARRNNPAFQQARNDVAPADWGVRSAYASWAPSAQVSGQLGWQGQGEQIFAGALTTGQLGIGDQPDYYTSNYQASVSWSVNGERIYGVARARAERNAAQARVEDAGRNLETTVTEQYLAVLSQEEAIRLVEQELERARFNLRLAEAQADVGTGTLLDVRQAEVQVGRSEVALVRSRATRTQLRAALLQTVGLDPAQEVELTTDFTLEEPLFDQDALFQEALGANPGLQATRQSAAAAVVNEKVARSAYFPTVSLSAGVAGFTRQAADSDFLLNRAQAQVAQQVASCQSTNEIYARLTNPLPQLDCSQFLLTDDLRSQILASNDVFPFDFTRSPPFAGLTVSIPVFQGLSRQQSVETARAQTQDLRYQIQEQRLALRAGIASNLAQLEAAYAAALIEERNQSLADEQLRLARERYQVGQIPFVELVEAETVKSQADRDRLVAVFDYHIALTALEAAVGRSLRNR